MYHRQCGPGKNASSSSAVVFSVTIPALSLGDYCRKSKFKALWIGGLLMALVLGEISRYCPDLSLQELSWRFLLLFLLITAHRVWAYFHLKTFLHPAFLSWFASNLSLSSSSLLSFQSRYRSLICFLNHCYWITLKMTSSFRTDHVAFMPNQTSLLLTQDYGADIVFLGLAPCPYSFKPHSPACLYPSPHTTGLPHSKPPTDSEDSWGFFLRVFAAQSRITSLSQLWLHSTFNSNSVTSFMKPSPHWYPIPWQSYLTLSCHNTLNLFALWFSHV